jgi:hypothetical protein
MLLMNVVDPSVLSVSAERVAFVSHLLTDDLSFIFLVTTLAHATDSEPISCTTSHAIIRTTSTATIRWLPFFVRSSAALRCATAHFLSTATSTGLRHSAIATIFPSSVKWIPTVIRIRWTTAAGAAAASGSIVRSATATGLPTAKCAAAALDRLRPAYFVHRHSAAAAGRDERKTQHGVIKSGIRGSEGE